MQPYYLIKLPSKKIREIARKYLAGNWKKVFTAMVLYFIFTTGAASILDFFFSFESVDVVENMPIGYKLPFGGSIYQLFIWGPMAYGLALYLITFFRTKKSDNGLLFEGFSHFGKSFAMMFVISIKVFLWTLLFIIPGIIAAVRYSQAFFILIDHPEYRVKQCINASKQIMRGNESKYISLIISFIGWLVLAFLPSMIYTQYSDDTFMSVIISFVLLIPTCITDAYIHVSRAAFYDLVIGRLVVVQGNNEPYREKVDPQYGSYGNMHSDSNCSQGDNFRERDNEDDLKDFSNQYSENYHNEQVYSHDDIKKENDDENGTQN